jgi:hypothetical protein
MTAIASADPDALDRFADTARQLAVRQRGVTRRLELAIDATRRDHRVPQSLVSASRALRSIALSYEELASEAIRSAEAFRQADRVLAALGSAAVSSGGTGAVSSGGTGAVSSGGSAWELDVPMPGTDWDFSWIAPGFPRWDWSAVGDRSRLDLEAGIGPRIQGGAGIGVVDGVLQLGAELEGSLGAWARAAVASGLGPLVATASGELFVGATAGAQAAASIGRNGAAIVAGAGAFAGARASGDVGLRAGPVGIGASGAATAGIGAKADLDAALGWERIRVRYDLGATLGLGFELGGEFHVEPRELFDGAVDLGDDALDSANEILRDGVGVGAVVVEDTFDTGKDLLGKSVTAVGGLFR